jgi:hypothetical protein
MSNVEHGIMNVEGREYRKPISKLDSLIDENNQLISIFVISIKTTKENK